MSDNTKELSKFNTNYQVKAKDFYTNIKNQILEGNISATDAMIFFKKNTKIFELLKEDDKIRDIFEEEFQQNREGKSVKKYGNRITETNRSYWDYSECNDPELEELEKIEKRVKELIKARQEKLKALHPDKSKENFGIQKFELISNKSYSLIEESVDTEVFSVNPPKKGQTTSMTFYV